MVNQYFEIIDEVSFSGTVKSLKKQYPRIEEIVDDLNWACQKNPFLGTAIEQQGDYEARVIHTMAIGQTPAFWVLIEIDKRKEQVTFISITPIDENQNG
ncbi:hypothetical protein EG832_09200 [bacterium]|nr:hypothetical protein [bacterium]